MKTLAIIIQSSFTALEIVYALPIHLSLHTISQLIFLWDTLLIPSVRIRNPVFRELAVRSQCILGFIVGYIQTGLQIGSEHPEAMGSS